jgi:hypothetical protein
MAATALPGMPSAGQAAGGDMLALRAEATGRRRAAGHGLGRLRFAFYGRVSTEDWQDPVTSRARQRDQAVALVAGHGRIVAEFFELGVSVHGLLRVGGRVAGVMTSAGERRARLVIGADGRNSRIARLAQAKTYHDHPPVTFGYYTYWRGARLPACTPCSNPAGSSASSRSVAASRSRSCKDRAPSTPGSAATPSRLRQRAAVASRAGRPARRGSHRRAAARHGCPAHLLSDVVGARLGAGGRRRAPQGPGHRPRDRRCLPRRGPDRRGRR